MKKIPLGKSGLKIAPLIFGGNVFGWTINEKTGFELLDEFSENGFNCIDTADIYSAWAEGNKGGESETIIGNWIKSRNNREKIIVATKCGYGINGAKNDLSKSNIFKCVEASLLRLQTAYIDLYQVHVDDPETPQEETLNALNELIKLGKIRAMGCSNFETGRIASALKICQEKILIPYSTLQPEYNLYDREKYESELQTICIENEIGVIPFFPLAAGFLSGKYRNEKDSEGKARAPRIKKYLNEKGYKILNALDIVAKEYKAQPAEIALAWLAAQPGITAPIASATTLPQLKSLMKSVRLSLSEEAIKLLNTSSPFKSN